MPASTASSPRSRPRILVFAALSALFVGAALWRPSDHGFQLCHFKRLTTISCPGCGMTRALAALGKGDVETSLRYHLFAPLVAAAAVLGWLALAIGLFTGLDLIPAFTDRLWTIVLLSFIAAFVAYWIFRLWTGTAP